jgi:uroporphyrinogen-III decarboxylase
MNSKQRVDAVIHGEVPDRVPVCLHNFLPAVEEAGMRMEDYLTDPECAARAHLQAVEKYGHDCILIDLDTTRNPQKRCMRFSIFATGATSPCIAPCTKPGRISLHSATVPPGRMRHPAGNPTGKYPCPRPRRA